MQEILQSHVGMGLKLSNSCHIIFIYSLFSLVVFNFVIGLSAILLSSSFRKNNPPLMEVTWGNSSCWRHTHRGHYNGSWITVLSCLYMCYDQVIEVHDKLISALYSKCGLESMKVVRHLWLWRPQLRRRQKSFQELILVLRRHNGGRSYWNWSLYFRRERRLSWGDGEGQWGGVKCRGSVTKSGGLSRVRSYHWWHLYK